MIGVCPPPSPALKCPPLGVFFVFENHCFEGIAGQVSWRPLGAVWDPCGLQNRFWMVKNRFNFRSRNDASLNWFLERFWHILWSKMEACWNQKGGACWERFFIDFCGFGKPSWVAKPSQERAKTPLDVWKISLRKGVWAVLGGLGALLGGPGRRGAVLGHLGARGVRRGSADLTALGALLAPSWGRLGPFWPSKSILDGQKIGSNLD